MLHAFPLHHITAGEDPQAMNIPEQESAETNRSLCFSGRKLSLFYCFCSFLQKQFSGIFFLY